MYPIMTGKHYPTMGGKNNPAIDSSPQTHPKLINFKYNNEIRFLNGT